MKKIIIYSFAILGVLWLISKTIEFYRTERRTQMYWENCEQVEIGMTLEEARKIIGDLEYQFWTQDDRSGEITVNNTNGKQQYILEYDMVFAGSENMKIYFDPITLLVTDKFCGE